MADNVEFVQLSERCFKVCQTLRDAIQEGSLDDSGNWRTAIEGLERCVYQILFPLPAIPRHHRAIRQIEGTVRRGASTPHTGYNKENIESGMLEIQRLLDTLRSLNASPSRDPNTGERNPNSTSVNSRDAIVAFVSERGTSSSLPSPTSLCASLTTKRFTHDTLARRRLIRRAFCWKELPYLIKAAFSDENQREVIRRLPMDDAQMLIDAIHQASLTFTSHREC
jgi:hypothetical protein